MQNGGSQVYQQLDPVAKGYAQALVFCHGCSSFEREWEGITENDFAPETLAGLIADCARFLKAAAAVHPGGKTGLLGDIDAEQLGHTFFLSRQGSGVCFEDRDLEEDVATRLDELADNEFGYIEVEIGSDRKIHFLV